MAGVGLARDTAAAASFVVGCGFFSGRFGAIASFRAGIVYVAAVGVIAIGVVRVGVAFLATGVDRATIAFAATIDVFAACVHVGAVAASAAGRTIARASGAVTDRCSHGGRARSLGAGRIAASALSLARRLAADAIDAASALASLVVRASRAVRLPGNALAVHALAIAIAVVGAARGARRIDAIAEIKTTGRSLRAFVGDTARSLRTEKVAPFAIALARGVAANAVDAVTGTACVVGVAAFAERDLGRAGAERSAVSARRAVGVVGARQVGHVANCRGEALKVIVAADEQDLARGKQDRGVPAP